MQRFKKANTFVNMGSKGHFYLSTDEDAREDYEYGYVNTNLSLFADYEVEYKDLMIMPTNDFYVYDGHKKTEKGFEVNYRVTTYPSLLITENVQHIEGTEVFRQTTRVKNEAKDFVRLTRLSCANVTGIGINGTRWTEDDNRFQVYFSYNHWQGEGQWQKRTLKQLGIYPGSGHPWEKCTFRLQSTSSWSTSDYYPLMIIEDTERGECWFFEREGAENWFIEINAFEGSGSPFFNVAIGGADEHLGWHYDLQSNETYQTGVAVYGVVKGTFEDAVRELTKYKRKTNLAKEPIEVSFNDFMNCNWGQPVEDTLIQMIDRAAEVGVECFCIDDGWSKIGEWIPYDHIFPKLGGFKGFVDYIRSKGMRAGVWFEFQRADASEIEKEKKDSLMQRKGAVIARHRPKWNMQSKEVRDWLMECIDRVYQAGVRYIKNDHNSDERIGTDFAGASPAEGVKKNEEAFLSFIDEVREKYPDMLIENCGAGAMRDDYGTLRHFHLQSTTDQEDYRLYPSILVGESAYLLPEKAGIWGYPYPLLYKNMFTKKIPQEELEGHKDGRETVFNMVTAMMGYMYLSGRIEEADAYNLSLISEGIQTYKSYKDTIEERYPAFILPFRLLSDKTYNAYGLQNEKDMILAVWAMEQTEFALDLEKYGVQSVEKIYPVKREDCTYTFDGKALRCNFAKPYSATLFRCVKKD